MKTFLSLMVAGLSLLAWSAPAQTSDAGLEQLQQQADSLRQQLRDEWRLNREKLREINTQPGADAAQQDLAKGAENKRYQAKAAELSTKQEAAEKLIAENLKQRWQEVDSGWKAEVKRYDDVRAKIESEYPPPAERSPAQREQCNRRLEAESVAHRQRSTEACAKRDAIHQDFKAEVNRQVEGGNAKGASRPLQDTAGSKATTMNGDLDGGAGARTVAKAEKLMNKMGISTKRQGGVLEAQGNFNLTINTEGGMGPVGSSAHQTQVRVDAMHKETYVSETAKMGPELKAELATLDHSKKAAKGQSAAPAELVGKSELGQSLAKGTFKAVVDSKLALQPIPWDFVEGLSSSPPQ